MSSYYLNKNHFLSHLILSLSNYLWDLSGKLFCFLVNYFLFILNYSYYNYFLKYLIVNANSNSKLELENLISIFMKTYFCFINFLMSLKYSLIFFQIYWEIKITLKLFQLIINFLSWNYLFMWHFNLYVETNSFLTFTIWIAIHSYCYTQHFYFSNYLSYCQMSLMDSLD